MTRSWVFTLAAAGTWYNLWYDLITKDPAFLDATFTNAPFIPSQVCELQIQSPSTLNPGVVLNVSYDGKKEGGTELTSGVADLRRSNRNLIGLKQCYIKSDTAGGIANVVISAN